MLTILVALISGAAVGGLFRAAHFVHTIPGAITPAVLATLVTAVLLLRRAGKRIQPLVEDAQRHLQAGRREMALKSLRSGLELRSWHPLLEAQLRTQIGALHYASGEYDEAIAELRRAASRPWESPAFLACAYFKKHKEPEMVKAFERAVKTGAKNGLSWTVYAWCMNARGKKDEALKILKRASEKVPAGTEKERVTANVELLEQGKKLKVAPYGEQWAAFGLDGSVPSVPKGMRGMAQRPGFRPGFRQRPARRR
jgi:tetratricopeptide (TPR) repeat protein